MREKLAERILKLLEVKSIITLMVIGVALYLVSVGRMQADNIESWVSMLMVYFFTKDIGKKSE